MKIIISYFIFCITCLLNWIVLAYKPISKIFTKNSFMNVKSITNFLTSPIHQSKYEKSSFYDTNKRFSFQLNALWSAKVCIYTSVPFLAIICNITFLIQDKDTSHERNLIEQFTKVFAGSDIHHQPSYRKLNALKTDFQSDSAPITLDSMDYVYSKQKVVGFMDYDPKNAAMKTHNTLKDKNTKSSINNWFKSQNQIVFEQIIDIHGVGVMKY